MGADRDETGQFTPEHTDAEILAAVRAHEPAATSEVSDEIGLTRQGADRRLRRLRDEGRVSSKKIAASLVWFAPEPTDEERQEPDKSAALADAGAAGYDRSAATTGDEQGAVRADTPDLDGVLRGWEPDTETNAKAARAQTRRAVGFLRDRAPERFTKSEFQSALADESALGKRSWWERAVRPGLRRLVDAGLIEYRAGSHDYRWIGDNAGQTPMEG